MAITTLGLDGDDTLWHSENYFAVTTDRLVELLAPWSPELSGATDAASAATAQSRLITIERRNLALLGYGVKAFTLSMIETAIEVSDGQIPAGAIREIIGWGHELLAHPVELLEGVDDTIRSLCGEYDLLLITKGDLLHQESKIAQSGIESSFRGIEIISEKNTATYRRVLDRHSVDPSEFVMVGNSVRSDVVPVLELGGRAVHVPYEVTWELEHHEPDEHTRFPMIDSIRDLAALLADWPGTEPQRVP